MEREEFLEKVNVIKKHIVSGYVEQIILSQRFEVITHLSPFEIYRRLRYINPSPYMFLFKLPEFQIIGSSPESLVKVKDGEVIYRPIAGTLPKEIRSMRTIHWHSPYWMMRRRGQSISC